MPVSRWDGIEDICIETYLASFSNDDLKHYTKECIVLALGQKDLDQRRLESAEQIRNTIQMEQI